MEETKEEINTDEIMEKIREKIRKKKKFGAYNEVENKKVHETSFMYNNIYHDQSEDDMENFLNHLSQIWDPRENGDITSHRPIIGPFIVFIKKVLRRVLDLSLIRNVLLSHQAEFNFQLIKFLNSFVMRYQKSFTDLSNNIMEIKQENILLKHRLERLSTEIIKKHGSQGGSATNLVREKKHVMDYDYFLFENRFRGKQEEIKRKFEAYLPVFKGSDNVLDIGCGRGEFLELLQAEGIKAKGIDVNEDMIYTCKEKKLDVKKIDVITYLNSIEDNSLGGIFASHIIEHFKPDLLIDFIKACYYKLNKGGSIAIETPNPLSIIVSAVNFYLDPSHIKPIHPETIKFLLEVNGFIDLEIKYLSPYPDEAKLQTIAYEHSEESSEIIPVELMNKNIEKLNKLLYGYQDYAVIGKK